MSQFAAIIVAAGKSSRFHDAHYKKPFAPLENRAVWLHSADRFVNRDDVKQLIVVIAPEDREEFMSKFGANVAILGIEVVDGGAERSDSVRAALARVRPEIDFIAVHDAARPCIANEWIDAVFSAAEKHDAAILAIPVSGTLKRVRSGSSTGGHAATAIEETVSRDRLWEAQTPQVFRRQLLVDAYARLKGPATDDAQVVEMYGREVVIVPGSPVNLKITTKDDLRLAAQAIKALPKPKLLGPAHPFADDDMWR